MPDVPRREVGEAKRWFHRRLVAKVELVAIIPAAQIHVDHVQRSSEGPVFPYILGNFMGGFDVQGMGTARQQTHGDFQWRVVTDGPPGDDAYEAEGHMDDALQTAVNDPQNGWLFTCRRVAPIDRPEFDKVKTKQYHNIGGIYRVWIGKAP